MIFCNSSEYQYRANKLHQLCNEFLKYFAKDIFLQKLESLLSEEKKNGG